MDLKHLIFHMTRFSHRGSPLDKKTIKGSMQFVKRDSEISWFGVSWICDKQLKHFPSFCRNKTNIYINSIVWILGSGERKTCLGYIEDMYENREKEKMVRIQKLLFREEIEGQNPNPYPLSREVLITHIAEHISAKDVDGLASILSPNHFDDCEESLPLILSFQTFVCRNEFKDDEISAFNVDQLLGYYMQPLVSYLGYYIPDLSNNARNLREESRLRKGKSSPQYSKAKISRKGFKANNEIELLCQESGMQGCWLRCKILRISRNRMKVHYHDIIDGDGQLEEWVPAAREASPDKLGMRFASRLTVRPCPDWDSSNVTFELGQAVDAWWLDGWWEGIFIRYDSSTATRAQVYFAGEEMMMIVERRNVRESKDWIDEKWVDIMPNPHFDQQLQLQGQIKNLCFEM